MKLKSALLFPLLFILFTLSTNLAYGQDSSTITAIPPRLELNIKPGETIKTQLKVRNESSYTQTYDINLTDFIVTDDSGTPIPILSDINTKFAASKWITAPSLIPVDSKKTQYVNLTITAPQNAAPGGHYALLTYSPHSDNKPGDMKKTGSLIGQQTGTILYLTVPGVIKQNAQINRFRTDKFNEMGPVNFEIKVKNLSDVHIAPKGKLIIKDFLGKIVSSEELAMGNIFPNSLRSDSAIWNQKWGYGKYQANLELAYGTAGGLLTATIFFWLFPIRLVTYILILVISLLLAILLVRNKQLKHQRDLEKEVQELKKELENK